LAAKSPSPYIDAICRIVKDHCANLAFMAKRDADAGGKRGSIKAMTAMKSRAVVPLPLPLQQQQKQGFRMHEELPQVQVRPAQSAAAREGEGRSESPGVRGRWRGVGVTFGARAVGYFCSEGGALRTGRTPESVVVTGTGGSRLSDETLLPEEDSLSPTSALPIAGMGRDRITSPRDT
jgi:hypothetical protein